MTRMITANAVALSFFVTFLLFPAHGTQKKVTHKEFAVELAKQLEECQKPICDYSDPPDCMQALKALGVEPPGGWRPDDIITEDDIGDLTNDLILAAKDKKILCTPQRVVDLLAVVVIKFGMRGYVVYKIAYGTLGFYFPPEETRGGEEQQEQEEHSRQRSRSGVTDQMGARVLRDPPGILQRGVRDERNRL
jgi:hypothetical protein